MRWRVAIVNSVYQNFLFLFRHHGGRIFFRTCRNFRMPGVKRSRGGSAIKPTRMVPARKFGTVYSKADGSKWQNKWQPYEIGSLEGMYGRTWKSASEDQRAARKANQFYGLGAYSRRGVWRTARPYIPRALGAAAGGIATRSLAGAARGWGLGAQASKLIGWGDYGAPVDNQIIHGSPHKPLSVNQAGNLSGDIFFTHREFVSNITVGGTGFENRGFSINPGLSETFPFLSQIAANFTLYKFHGLVFEYRPLSGEFGSGSNNLGKVIVATNYDPDADAFFDSVEMENYDYANSSKPSIEMRHGVETDPNQRAVDMKFIRTGESTRDKIFTDIGLFQIGTEGIPDTGICGQIWVSYTVQLSRAKLYHSIDAGMQFDNFVSQALLSGTFDVVGNPDPDYYFATKYTVPLVTDVPPGS